MILFGYANGGMPIEHEYDHSEEWEMFYLDCMATPTIRYKLMDR